MEFTGEVCRGIEGEFLVLDTGDGLDKVVK
jgi:hypothetical protein